VSCPESFSTSWNPHDRARSARRSREFVLKSFLSSAVDGIDTYLSLLNREPKYFSDKEIEHKICAGERSVYRKLENLANYLKINEITLSLCMLLIIFRNNMIHAIAENELDEKYRQVLLYNIDLIRDKYRGLEINMLLV